MSDRLEGLLEKYWNGETDLAEEAEMKSLLRHAKGYELEKEFFNGLKSISDLEPQEVRRPGKQARLWQNWRLIAASVLVLLIAGVFYQKEQSKKAEQQAYEQVMEALALIQVNMQKGTSSMHLLQEMKHLNTTREIFQIPDKPQNP